MTKAQRQKLVDPGSFPYSIEMSLDDGETWIRHSYIQTLTDERVFVQHARHDADYRIAQTAVSIRDRESFEDSISGGRWDRY